MLGRIARRGPDGQGHWEAASGQWHVALGHRRLAILDIAGGAQPMGTAEGSAWVTYNGELYNFVALRRSLERRGVAFRTRSDTEVVLRHVEAHGTAGLDALDGMFAFALWDAGSERLLLARDRVGIKPLYYAPLPDGGIVFASELTALAAHARVRRRLSAIGLRSYFFSDYVHPPHTLLEGVFKLPPGHWIAWKNGQMTAPSAYWALAAGPGEMQRPRAAGRELWRRLGAAVESQLVADVPVGALLSGGLDSSCVATLAQRRYGRRLKTFSIAFDDPTFDESRYARLVARRIGSEHVEERLNEKNVLEVVELALSQLDEPLADPSYLPTFLLARLAAAHAKVVLSGDGGDELFGGYPTYRAHAWAPLLKRLPLRSWPFSAWVGSLRERDRYQSLEWKLKRLVLRWDDDPVRRHLRWMSNLDVADVGRAVPPVASSPPSTLAGSPPRVPDGLNAMMALDFCTYLPGSVLTKVDRASMAHGLEVRPPFLSNALVDWAFSLPSSLKIHRGRSKFVLAVAASGSVPATVLRRTKKGFGIPLRAWIRGPLRGRLARALEPSALWATGLLDRDAFGEWARLNAERRGDFSKALWALIVLDDWVRRENVDG
jgi:asparagine synthase (glutamine-hydrolysing)